MSEPAKTDRVQVIDRSIDLLEALADGPRTLADICRATGLSKGTAFRLLAGLAVRGIVMKDPIGSTYMLGPGLLRLMQGALSGIGSIASLGRGALQDLSHETGETVGLYVQSGLERVCVAEILSQQSIRYTSLVGSVTSIQVGSSGIVLLAFMPEEQSRRVLTLLETSVEDLDRKTLETKMKAARRDGWAISIGERVAEVSGISVPVKSSMLLLSLSVVGPTTRLPRPKLKGFVPAMQRAADRLIASLDAQGPLALEQAS